MDLHSPGLCSRAPPADNTSPCNSQPASPDRAPQLSSLCSPLQGYWQLWRSPVYFLAPHWTPEKDSRKSIASHICEGQCLQATPTPAANSKNPTSGLSTVGSVPTQGFTSSQKVKTVTSCYNKEKVAQRGKGSAKCHTARQGQGSAPLRQGWVLVHSVKEVN